MINLVNIGEKNSIFNQFVSEIRDQNIQKDSMRFRRNLERMGEMFAYEISKKLDTKLRETILGFQKQKTSIEMKLRK